MILCSSIFLYLVIINAERETRKKTLAVYIGNVFFLLLLLLFLDRTIVCSIYSIDRFKKFKKNLFSKQVSSPVKTLFLVKN